MTTQVNSFDEPSDVKGTDGAMDTGYVGWRAWGSVLRPRQWVKNLFILAPLLFSGQLRHADSLERALAALAIFCGLSSGVYLFNDLIDRESDRVHPRKRRRAIAAGAISASHAVVAAAVLLAASATGAFALKQSVGVLAAVYIGLNLAYSLWLKHVVILDVFTIALFFVLRLLVGAAAVAVVPSIWLLLCGGLLALYLAFAKRRHELESLKEMSGRHRAVLAECSTAFLDSCP